MTDRQMTFETAAAGLTALVKPKLPKSSPPPMPFEAQLNADALLYTVYDTVKDLLHDNGLHGGGLDVEKNERAARQLSSQLYDVLLEIRQALCTDAQPPFNYHRLTPADVDAIKRRPDLWETFGPDPDEKNGGMVNATKTENGRTLAASRPHLQELVDKLRAMEAEDPHNDHLRERAEDMLAQFNDIVVEFDDVWERVNSICESYARIDAA